MFNIQTGNKYQLHKLRYIKEVAQDKASGYYNKFSINDFIQDLSVAAPTGIVTIKKITSDRFYIEEHPRLFIKEWMIKEYIAGGR